MQVQTRGDGVFKPCVEVRPRGYHGVVEAMWRITTEERSEVSAGTGVGVARRKGKGKEREEREDDGWVTWEGIGQLYHGLGLGMGAVIVVSLSSLFGVDREEGWTEL